MTDRFDRLMADMNDPTTVVGRNYARYSRSQDIRWKVLRNTMGRIPLIGGVLVTFWDGVIGDDVASPLVWPAGGVWALSFEYLGDYLFWHKPMTEDYYESWLSRVPWPRRLHVHKPPCRIARWRDDSGKPHRTAMVCTRRGPR